MPSVNICSFTETLQCLVFTSVLGSIFGLKLPINNKKRDAEHLVGFMYFLIFFTTYLLADTCVIFQNLKARVVVEISVVI